MSHSAGHIAWNNGVRGCFRVSSGSWSLRVEQMAVVKGYPTRSPDTGGEPGRKKSGQPGEELNEVQTEGEEGRPGHGRGREEPARRDPRRAATQRERLPRHASLKNLAKWSRRSDWKKSGRWRKRGGNGHLGRPGHGRGGRKSARRTRAGSVAMQKEPPPGAAKVPKILRQGAVSERAFGRRPRGDVRLPQGCSEARPQQTEIRIADEVLTILA